VDTDPTTDSALPLSASVASSNVVAKK